VNEKLLAQKENLLVWNNGTALFQALGEVRRGEEM